LFFLLFLFLLFTYYAVVNFKQMRQVFIQKWLCFIFNSFLCAWG